MKLLGPDPYSKAESGSRGQIEFESMRIRIRTIANKESPVYLFVEY
jgi:hypothetical protein